MITKTKPVENLAAKTVINFFAINLLFMLKDQIFLLLIFADCDVYISVKYLSSILEITGISRFLSTFFRVSPRDFVDIVHMQT